MATLEVFCYIYMLHYFINVWLFTFSIGLHKYWEKIISVGSLCVSIYLHCSFSLFIVHFLH